MSIINRQLFIMDNRQLWENIFQLSQAVFRVTHLFPKEEILRRHLRERITEILYQSSRGFSLESADWRIQPRDIFMERNRLLINDIHNFRFLLFTAKNFNFVEEKNLAVLIKESENLLEFLDKKNKENLNLLINQNTTIHERNNQNLQSPLSLSGITLPNSDVPKLIRKSPTSSRRILQRSMAENLTDKDMIGFAVLNIRQQKIIDYFHKFSEEKVRLKNIADEFKNIPPRTLRQDLKCLCDNGYLERDGFGPGSFYLFVKK